MTVLSIEQKSGLTANVAFDGGEWEVDFHDPFTPEQEEDLRWYFENHLEFPMLETVRAERAAASVEEYGASLFQQLFQDPELLAALRSHKTDQLRLEVSGAPEFHRLHWEALWDPKQPNPLAYRAVVTRRMHKKGAPKIELEAAAAIRVLVVVARPGREQDVGYRTISRPLVETVHQAQLDVELDFVRPGTWERLTKHLAGKPQGHYHALHFDGHGSVASKKQLGNKDKYLFHGAQAPDAADDQARQAFLFFEIPDAPGRKENPSRAIAADQLANLVNDARIPVVILNACQSARQEAEPETNLASRLSQAGVRAVLAMSYSVTVSAARNFMEAFYREAFDGKPLSEAVTRARQDLALKRRATLISASP